MIKLKDIIKEGVIEPLLEAETYKLKKKDGGKVVVFTNKDNYKKALKSGDYEEPDGKGGEEEKGKEDPGKLSGSDFDRQADKEEPKGVSNAKAVLDKVPGSYKEAQQMSPDELENLAKELDAEGEKVDKEVGKQVDVVNSIKPRPMGLNKGGMTLGLLPREKQPDKEAYDKYQEEIQKLNDLKRDREKLHDQSKRMMGIRQDVIDGENAEKAVSNLEKKESPDDIANRFLDQESDVFYLEDGDDEHEVHFSDLSDGMQKKIKDALQKRLDAVSDALTDYDEANMDTDIDNYRKAQNAFYDAQEKHGDGSSMMRLAKDLDMDVSDDKYDRLNYY
jgi:hypothetical protein